MVNRNNSPKTNIAASKQESVAPAVNDTAEPVDSAPVNTPTQQSPTITPATPTPEPQKPQNPYDYGLAQYHVYERRTAVGKTMSNKIVGNLGNYWLKVAQDDGYTVNTNPEQYAIAIRPTSPNSVMAFVESANTDGSLTLSAMNYASGFNRVDTFQVPQEQLAAWKFIH